MSVKWKKTTIWIITLTLRILTLKHYKINSINMSERYTFTFKTMRIQAEFFLGQS